MDDSNSTTLLAGNPAARGQETARLRQRKMEREKTIGGGGSGAAYVPLIDNRKVVHLHERVNEVIFYLQVGAALFLILICGLFNFWGGAYFKFGTPVLVHDTLIKEDWHFWLLMSLFFVDRLVAALDNKVMNHFRANEFQRRGDAEESQRVEAREGMHDHDKHSFAYVAFILVVDHAINWVRYSALIIFVYAQISFAIAFALPDIIVTILRGYRALQRYYHPNSPGTQALKDEDKSIWYKIPPLAVFFIQLAEIAAFMVVFWIVGFTKSKFFHFGPPVFMAVEVNYTWAYVLLVFFAAGEQMLVTLERAVVGPWVNDNVYNNSCVATSYTESMTLAIFVVRKFVGWVRMLTIVNFASAQLMFVISMFVGDMIMTFLLTWASWARTVQGSYTDRIANSLPSVATITGLTVLEVSIIIAAAISAQVWRNAYFDWPPPLTVFDTLLARKGEIGVILFFAACDRVVDTLTSEILYPYINNVIYGGDHHDRVYSEADNQRIMSVNLVTSWMRRIVAYNFLFSNISFVFVAAIIDIPLSTLIAHRHMLYKRACLREAELAAVALFAERNRKTVLFQKGPKPIR